MHKDHKCGPSKIAWILVLIGAINWGLIGLGYFFSANWNLVNLIFGRLMWLEAIVYLLVGIGGAIVIFGCRCHRCKEGCNSCHAGTASSAPMGGQQM
ncbi:MAG: DUF378 domain-containing protein [Candidatus Pacebacteria bacterium]|nr:DUF378 domain-containing protein [Candidatus Paceibacterota bacterium]